MNKRKSAKEIIIMNKPTNWLIVLFIFILNIPGFGQKIEFYSGALYNNFTEFTSANAHRSVKYSDNWGFSMGVAIDSIKAEWHTLRIALQYDAYGGNFSAHDGGNGGSYGVDGQIHKHIMSLSIYPINIRRLIKRMQISIGLTGSVLIKESFSGEHSAWSIGQPTITGKLEDKYNSYASRFTFGIQSLINYQIPISKTLEIVPQYSFYFGLSKELKEMPKQMKSIRHYFAIGLRKKL